MNTTTVEKGKLIIKFDLSELVERLVEEGYKDCHLMSEESVSTALKIWINDFMDDFEEGPHWYIKKHKESLFTDHLEDPDMIFEEPLNPDEF